MHLQVKMDPFAQEFEKPSDLHKSPVSWHADKRRGRDLFNFVSWIDNMQFDPSSGL